MLLFCIGNPSFGNGTAFASSTVVFGSPVVECIESKNELHGRQVPASIINDTVVTCAWLSVLVNTFGVHRYRKQQLFQYFQFLFEFLHIFFPFLFEFQLPCQ